MQAIECMHAKSCLGANEKSLFKKSRMFFAFDGLDGVGKTTQIERFEAWLREGGYDVVTCRDPGSTPLGERIRGILLDAHDLAIGKRSEMLLYMAARAQLVEEVIQPALAAGKVVLSDRFLLANVVYQGHAGDLDPQSVWQVGHLATAGISPLLTILLDMPCQAASARLDRPLDRIEKRGDTYRQRVRAGYLAEALSRPNEILVIDADQPIERVHHDILRAVVRAIQRDGRPLPPNAELAI